MAKAIAIFTGGIQNIRQVAIREDGVVFSRGQERDPRYGYRWSAWRATGETMGENARQGIGQMDCGWDTLRRATPDDCNINNRAMFNAKGEIRARLP
jgi:hypothetical protein